MKLPNGYGSVYKLSGTRRKPWIARKTIGWDYYNPKTQKHVNPDDISSKELSSGDYVVRQIKRTVGYYATQKEALTSLANYNINPYDLDLNKITFSEVYDKWTLDHFPKVSESNIKGYKAAYKLCYKLYNKPFNDITFDHLQNVIDVSGKNTPTLRKLKVLLGLVYDYAVLHDLCSQDKRNKIRFLDISKSGNPNKIDRTPFNSDEINLLWSKSSDKYIQIILILIYSGVRISELLDLRKENVNLKEKYFDIIRSKTASGVRRVPIADKILPFITSWYDNKSDYLICTPDGEHFLYRNYYDSYWKAYMTDLGLLHKPHDTRHTCVSLMAQKGIDERIIKKIVGHKGQGVTQVVYTHFEMQQLLETINLI